MCLMMFDVCFLIMLCKVFQCVRFSSLAHAEPQLNQLITRGITLSATQSKHVGRQQNMSNVGITIINHPPFITIFIGGMVTIKK